MRLARQVFDNMKPSDLRLSPIAIALGAVAIAGAAAWLLRRSAPASTWADPAAAALPAAAEAWQDVWEEAPNSFSFEPELESEQDREVSARPMGRNAGFRAPDDYDALSPEDLGAAFLAGATDTALEEAPSSTAEIAGFQVFKREVPFADSDELADADELADSEDAERVAFADERG